MKERLAVSDITQRIDNDKGLYCWWKSARQSKRKFIADNRSELERIIGKVLDGERKPHYLIYG